MKLNAHFTPQGNTLYAVKQEIVQTVQGASKKYISASVKGEMLILLPDSCTDIPSSQQPWKTLTHHQKK